jgi:hypothetical protein
MMKKSTSKKMMPAKKAGMGSKMMAKPMAAGMPMMKKGGKSMMRKGGKTMK